MYKYSKFRQIHAAIAGIFGFNRASRRLKRDKIKFNGLISTIGENKIPREKYSHKIPVAFCFNANGAKLAAVTIKSLLSASENRCDYDIYCIIDQDVQGSLCDMIRKVVKPTKSTVHFLHGNDDFAKSYRSRWPMAVWYRLMLPKLLPNVSRIIYADIDIIFCNDLIDVYEMDLGKNMVAGVPTQTTGYINSGFLLMDLDKIRKEKIYQKWIRVSQKEKFENPDQDLLNHTLRGRIAFLPLKYNFQPRLGSRIFRVYSKIELDDIKHNLVVMHYSNYIKPWGPYNQRPIYSELWWKNAKQTGLF